MDFSMSLHIKLARASALQTAWRETRQGDDPPLTHHPYARGIPCPVKPAAMYCPSITFPSASFALPTYQINVNANIDSMKGN